MTDELDDLLNGEDDSAKAELDTDELTASLPQDSQKVELDLEDAPFLEEDEDEDEEELPEEEAPSVVDEEPDGDQEPWFKNKRIVIPAAAVLLLLLAGLAIWLYTKPATQPVAEPEPSVEEIQPQEQPVAPMVEEEEVQEFIVSLAPFMVEMRGKDGEIHFLRCKFATVTENEKLSFEITQKTTTLRDAVFYYLKNKDMAYLADMDNADTLKADILSVINQYLSNGRLETLLIEEYLVK